MGRGTTHAPAQQLTAPSLVTTSGRLRGVPVPCRSSTIATWYSACLCGCVAGMACVWPYTHGTVHSAAPAVHQGGGVLALQGLEGIRLAAASNLGGNAAGAHGGALADISATWTASHAACATACRTTGAATGQPQPPHPMEAGHAQPPLHPLRNALLPLPLQACAARPERRSWRPSGWAWRRPLSRCGPLTSGSSRTEGRVLGGLGAGGWGLGAGWVPAATTCWGRAERSVRHGHT